MLRLLVGSGVAACVSLLAACSDETAAADASSEASSWYVVSSLLAGSGEGDTTSYIATVPSLDISEIDYDRAREFSGTADAWTHEGFVFVGSAETSTVTKFEVKDDGTLRELGEVSFADYGIPYVGFQNNTFISADKAYMINGATEYVIWNPDTMEITGTLKLPELEEKPGLRLTAAYHDRASGLRGNRYYQALYWTDGDYATYAAESVIVVVDIEKDEVLATHEVPCPGLDSTGLDAEGDLHFGPWMWAGPAHVVLDSPATCIVTIPDGSDEPDEETLAFSDIGDAHEGAALHYLADSKLIYSALDPSRSEIEDPTPGELSGAANWRLWWYDMESTEAAAVEGIDWNSGAYYLFHVDDRPYVLISAADYSSSTIYDLSDIADPEPLFKTLGWGIRLLKVR
jgi:hypothetical protein